MSLVKGSLVIGQVKVRISGSMELWWQFGDQFWMAMLAPKYCQADNRQQKIYCCKQRDAENIDDEKHRTLVPVFWNTFHKNRQITVHHKSEPSTFHPLPRVPPQILSEATAVFVLLRIHSRLGLEKPLDNRTTAAHAGVSCHQQRSPASGAVAPGPKPGRQNPNGTEGEKTLRKFGHVKKRSFGNCGHSKCSLDWKNIVKTLWVWDVLSPSSWYFSEAVSAMLAVKVTWIKHQMLLQIIRQPFHKKWKVSNFIKW